MNTYYEVTATIDGQDEVLYGSFDRNECKYEIDAERDNWKEQGYKKIRITSRQTVDTPDSEVYADVLITKHELFMQQAPALNFEYDEDELLELALERGFVTKVEGKDDCYMINTEYEGVIEQ